MMAQVTHKRAHAARNAIDQTMQRIEMLIERETEALRSRSAIDLKELSNGKNQALLELGLAARALEGIPLEEELVARLKALRGKLETNRAVLRMHLDAVREVANIVAATIQHSEWDGTYSQSVASGGMIR